MKIVIVGAGTAGWMSASYLSKNFPHYDINVIEDPDTPSIGVGESVTPHVLDFILKLGISEEDWIKETGAIHKLANKFIDWQYQGHSEYFSFTYPFSEKYIDSPKGHPSSLKGYLESKDATTLDAIVNLYKNGHIDKFDRYFNPQYPYMENLAYHHNNLTQPHAVSHHIDADKTSIFLKNHIALKNGVKHIKDKVISKTYENRKLKSVILDSGKEIQGDYFLDCTGFKRLIINEFDPGFLEYDYPIDSAIVGRTSYINPEVEMTNYTQSIAKPHGWQFKVTLQNRAGNGYCYSSKLSNEQEVYDDFIKNTMTEPRKITWKPGRLVSPAKANVLSIGLSNGFVEPLEANNLYTIIKTIRLAGDFLKKRENFGIEDHKSFNNRITTAIDDIKDYLMVHYTLAKRKDTGFWSSLNELGIRENHAKIVERKINNTQNSICASFKGETIFPNYVWAQFAISWGVDINFYNKTCVRKAYEFENYFSKSLQYHTQQAKNAESYSNFIRKIK